MSLVEVMVTTAVASIIMVAIGNSLLSLYQHQASITKKDQGNEFTASYSRVLTQNASCSDMLRGVTLPANGSPVEFVAADFIKSKATEALTTPSADDLMAGNEIEEGLICNSLTIEDSNFAPQDVNYGGVNYQRKIAEITLRMSIMQTNGERELKPRRFQVPVLVTAGNVIERCAAEMEVEDACTAMGASYDSASGNCIPSRNCYMRGTFTISRCQPNTGSCPPSLPNNLTGGLNCPDGNATRSQTGQFVNVYTESCGKKCTRRITNTMRYFVCMLCS